MQWLGDILSNWFYNIASTTLLLIAQFFCKLIRAFEDIYFWLLGTQTIPNNSKLNIFDLIIKDSRITGYIGIFFAIAGGLWIICFVVALIKGMMNQDTPGATKKAIINSVKSILGIVIIPFLCLSFFNIAFNLITYTVQQLNGSTESISKAIWESGYNGATIYKREDIDQITMWWDATNDIQFKDIAGQPINYNFFWVGESYHFDYFVVIVGALVLGICMAIASIKLCGRLINLIILYIISPVVVATMSVDDGKRYEAWKEISLAKLFSIMGSVLAMYIYLVLLNVISDARNSIAQQNIFTATIFFLICAIAGALMVIKGSDMLDSIVSQNSGGQDGLSPMGMASLGRVLGRGIGKAKTSLIGKPSAKGGNGGSNSSGNGTFNNTGSTGAWGSFKRAMGNTPMGKALNSIRQNGLVGAGVNAIAGIGTGIKDNHQINQDLKDDGFKHPNLHPILKHEQKQAINKDRQQLQNFKNQGVEKDDLKALKNNRLGSEEFKTKAIEIAKKYKENQENGVYR